MRSFQLQKKKSKQSEMFIDTSYYVKKTPSSYGEPGYYVEVDQMVKSITITFYY